MKNVNAVVVSPSHPLAHHAIPGRRTHSLVGAGVGMAAFFASALLPTLAYGGIEPLARGLGGGSRTGPDGVTTLVVLGIVLAVTAVVSLIVAVLVEQVPAAARPTHPVPVARRSRPPRRPFNAAQRLEARAQEQLGA